MGREKTVESEATPADPFAGTVGRGSRCGTSRTSRRRRIGFRLAALTVALLGVCVLGEIVLRAYVAARGWTPNCYAGSVQLLVPDATNGYRLARSFHLRSGVYEISTNRFGLRGPEIGIEKPPGTARIALLGGSSTFGYLVSDGQEASRVLERRLQAAGRDVQVLNAGVPGYNLFQTTNRYESLVSRFDPDVVVLYLGWNDLTYLASDEPEAARYRRAVPYPAWQRLLSRSTLYGFLAFRLLTPPAAFAPPRATRAAPSDAGAALFRANLERLTLDVRKDGAQPVICAQITAAQPGASAEVRAHLGATGEQQQQNAALGQWLHEALREFAREQQIPFIDAFKQIPANAEVLGDAIHLTPAGEVALAELLARELPLNVDP